ncbi:MAG: hypothetical protein CMP65_06095 [Flavobacteriales bacterium]|nr:hypothetical protein [Flavobacteriales bacterium]|tara:strand:- start:55 stop:429 length:375 start_codon:yes stop_codon:yes gene_type:complete
MPSTLSSSSIVFNSTHLRTHIFLFKSLPKKKQVHENHSLVMQEFKNHIKSYINFFNEWNTVPSWIEDEEEEEPYHDFVDIINDIYNSNSSYTSEPTPYGWLFLGIENSVERLPVSTPKNNPTSW